MQPAIKLVFLLIVYFWGAVPYSILVTKAKGIDLLAFGSKNAGATNVYRAIGFKWAALVFFLDFLKGYLACLLAAVIFHNDLVNIAVASAVIVGHTFSPFLNFKGGKGAATGLGVLLFIKPAFLIIAALIAASLIMVTRYVSLATISSAVLIISMAYIPYFGIPLSHKLFLTVICIYVIYKHKANINRLIQGQEKKI